MTATQASVPMDTFDISSLTESSQWQNYAARHFAFSESDQAADGFLNLLRGPR
jgi:hypothetical protein